ncbi:hypothetical protein AMTR_s00169p00043580 [Amborella trichopoda]|uniref:Uncharacterized protein n=2 Tax=Amborella trichopoda TaxID=13333 RepID=W1PJG6_AMBTC|nr:hypothetical protein AMTR_s00169p00043580 [Amborella trichopoda]
MELLMNSRKLLEARVHTTTIQAVPRELIGPRVAAKERAQGRIPAVVFKRENGVAVSRKQLLTTERKQIVSVLKSFKEEPFFLSRTFRLQIRAGPGSCKLLESGNVLPIKVHRRPDNGEVLNLVFVWADEGSELNVDVPIVFKGEECCPGIQKGGYLNKIRTSLKYLCPVDCIPPQIDVDLSSLDIGDRVFMKDIQVHSSLKLLSKNDNMPICKIVATQSQVPLEA